MKFLALLATPLLLLAGTAAWAQDATPPAKEPVPDPPLLGSAPADCQWTITYTPKTPEKEPVTDSDIRNRELRLRYSPKVLAKHVLKSGGQVVVYTEYEAGIKSEAWVVGGYLYELPVRAGQSIGINTKGQGDFSDISWVNADNFRGTVEWKGTKVHVYEASEPAPAPAPAPSPGAPRAAPTPATAPAKGLPHRAYIDAKTRLPVAVDIGVTVLTYQYSGPPATFPTPDERIKKIMRNAGMKPK